MVGYLVSGTVELCAGNLDLWMVLIGTFNLPKL